MARNFKWVQKNDKALAKQCHTAMKPRMQVAGERARAASMVVLGRPGPSSPGEAPGMRTGKVRTSLKTRVIGGMNPGFRVAPRDKTNKAILGRLTYGFTGRDKKGRVYHEPPRPWVELVLRQAKNDIVDALFSEPLIPDVGGVGVRGGGGGGAARVAGSGSASRGTRHLTQAHKDKISASLKARNAGQRG